MLLFGHLLHLAVCCTLPRKDVSNTIWPRWNVCFWSVNSRSSIRKVFSFSRTFCQIKRKNNKKTGHWVGAGKEVEKEVFVSFLSQETFSSHDCEGCCCRSPRLISIKDGKGSLSALYHQPGGDSLKQPCPSIHPSIVQTTTTKRGL